MYTPQDAKIVDYQQLSDEIFSLGLRLTDKDSHQAYRFSPGQFNMLYLFGVGEIPISIIPDVSKNGLYYHTIRKVGRVTQALAKLKKGDHVGIRGPFGRGWPIEKTVGKDVFVITGGLGCAPSVSIIYHIMMQRQSFGRLTILQGVKHSHDLLYREQYAQWAAMPNTEVLLTADAISADWPWYSGLITALIPKVTLQPEKTICLLCGPELMQTAAVDLLRQKNIQEESIYLNLERNMECAVGHCGHCQFGGKFICKDGPVFCYPDVKSLLGRVGF